MEDLNHNNLVDIKDLNLMLKNWSDDLETIKSNIVKNWGKNIKKKAFLFLIQGMIIIMEDFLSIKKSFKGNRFIE